MDHPSHPILGAAGPKMTISQRRSEGHHKNQRREQVVDDVLEIEQIVKLHDLAFRGGLPRVN